MPYAAALHASASLLSTGDESAVAIAYGDSREDAIRQAIDKCHATAPGVFFTGAPPPPPNQCACERIQISGDDASGRSGFTLVRVVEENPPPTTEGHPIYKSSRTLAGGEDLYLYYHSDIEGGAWAIGSDPAAGSGHSHYAIGSDCPNALTEWRAPPPSPSPSPPPPGQPMDPCDGTRATFDPGYGDCTTYASGASNANYCTMDGADPVCFECGVCADQGRRKLEKLADTHKDKPGDQRMKAQPIERTPIEGKQAMAKRRQEAFDAAVARRKLSETQDDVVVSLVTACVCACEHVALSATQADSPLDHAVWTTYTHDTSLDGSASDNLPWTYVSPGGLYLRRTSSGWVVSPTTDLETDWLTREEHGGSSSFCPESVGPSTGAEIQIPTRLNGTRRLRAAA